MDKSDFIKILKIYTKWYHQESKKTAFRIYINNLYIYIQNIEKEQQKAPKKIKYKEQL